MNKGGESKLRKKPFKAMSCLAWVAKTLIETPSSLLKELRNRDALGWKASGEVGRGELEKVITKILCMNHASPLGLPVCVTDTRSSTATALTIDLSVKPLPKSQMNA